MTKKNLNSIEQTTAERRAGIAKRMHVANMGDGFHILEIPAADGSPFKSWPGPFKTKRAAELFLDDLLDAYARGKPIVAIREYGRNAGLFEAYGERARILEFLEKRDGIADPRALAYELNNYRPWVHRDPDECPF